MSDHRMGMRELAEQFKGMEIKYDLFNKRTDDGIYYWDIFRYIVYMTILSQYGIYKSAGIFLDHVRAPAWKRFAKAIQLFPSYLVNQFRFIFLLPRKKTYCFLKISRFEDERGNPVDLVLQDIYEQVKDDAFVIEYFRHPAFGWFKRNVKNGYFLYPLELGLLIRKEKGDNWSSLSGLINKEFSIDVNWQGAFQNRMTKYREEYRFFSKLFRQINPCFLFFQSDPKGMIAAANDLGILTIDLQHGHTNNAGMHYSYPQNLDLSHINSTPRIFLTLGEFWNNVVDFPNKKITCGNSYFYIRYDDNASKKRGVMAVSGFFIHDFLMRQIAELAKCHPEIVFYYKLHSSQGHQIIECRTFFEPYKNVIVIYTEKNVKEIMEDCFAVALVQSTVAYQALQKGLRVFIFKTDYFEASYDIFDEKGVMLVNDWKEFSNNIDTMRKNEYNSSVIYFQPYDPTVIKNLLNHDLN